MNFDQDLSPIHMRHNFEVNRTGIGDDSFDINLLPGLEPTTGSDGQNRQITITLEQHSSTNHGANPHSTGTVDKEWRVAAIVQIESLDRAERIVIDPESEGGVEDENRFCCFTTHSEPVVIRILSGDHVLLAV